MESKDISKDIAITPTELLNGIYDDKTAIFIDHENFNSNLGYKSNNYALNELLSIKKYCQKESCILVLKVYINNNIINYTNRNFFELGFEVISVPSFKNKSLADPMMICDILKTLYERPDVNNFVIITGDKDFTPVIHTIGKHKEKKKVKIISPIDNDMLIKACSSFDFEFLKYDDFKEYLDNSTS